MSFFGKLKNRHNDPPAPPKRIENNAGYGWPEDEFDEEDGDTYEAPPCERPAMTAPSREVEENVYLDERTPNSVIPKRPAAPPPRPAKVIPKQQEQQDSEEYYIDPNDKKPPEVDRKEKPGKKPLSKKTSPSGRSVSGPPPVPVPTPTPYIEEDVYLDPNEDQGDNDDVYLEPTAACVPIPRGTVSPRGVPILPMPIMKPPVPRAPSNSFLFETKTFPAPDSKRMTFPAKLPPPTPGGKPPIPGPKEPKPKPSPPPPPPTVDNKATNCSTGMKAGKQADYEDKEWFAGDCNRKTAEDLLLRINKDGAFLIRHSSAQNTRQPYTLAVLYREKVYNVPIRFLEETQGYALGKEGKKSEEMFSSLQKIISHHKNNQLLLIDSKSQAKHTTYLTHPARP